MKLIGGRCIRRLLYPIMPPMPHNDVHGADRIPKVMLRQCHHPKLYHEIVGIVDGKRIVEGCILPIRVEDDWLESSRIIIISSSSSSCCCCGIVRRSILQLRFDKVVVEITSLPNDLLRAAVRMQFGLACGSVTSAFQPPAMDGNVREEQTICCEVVAWCCFSFGCCLCRCHCIINGRLRIQARHGQFRLFLNGTLGKQLIQHRDVRTAMYGSRDRARQSVDVLRLSCLEALDAIVG
mmetsp:Transcript_22864/g.64732  ORF Transcript_22864/g.64732 Transcript_22864/m.64732 type:complete len:237 (+) Transcript_22864:1929-2639(+)